MEDDHSSYLCAESEFQVSVLLSKKPHLLLRASQVTRTDALAQLVLQLCHSVQTRQHRVQMFASLLRGGEKICGVKMRHTHILYKATTKTVPNAKDLTKSRTLLFAHATAILVPLPSLAGPRGRFKTYKSSRLPIAARGNRSGFARHEQVVQIWRRHAKKKRSGRG